MVNNYRELLKKLDSEFPSQDEICGGPVDIVLRGSKYVAFCTDSSDGYCRGFLTVEQLMEVSQYFKEVANLVQLANIEKDYDLLQAKFKRGVDND